MFEKHAGANTKTQADHIFFSNGFNLYKVSQIVRNIPEEDVSVKILKLRGDLKQEHLSEELRCDPTNIVTARRYFRIKVLLFSDIEGFILKVQSLCSL